MHPTANWLYAYAKPGGGKSSHAYTIPTDNWIIIIYNAWDLAFAVTKLAQHAANPSKEHLDKAKYILRYLAGTAKYALVYKGASNKGLIAYTDSDYASDPVKRRSTAGHHLKLADGIISWQSRA